MKHQFTILVFFIFFADFSSAQENNLSFTGIPPDLLANANAVIRNETISVEVKAVNEIIVSTSRTVTVLNKYGEGAISAGSYYDKSTKIKDQKATVYDSEGKEIKKFKRKDFRDVSAVSSNDLFNDNRIEYLDYTPQKYPYTIFYEGVITSESTAFIHPWNPVPSYYVSVQNSTYNFINPKNIPFRFDAHNLENIEVEKVNINGGFSYRLKNLPSYKREYLSPDLENISPKVLVALSEFSLVGVAGKATNWEEFGKWQYNNLLAGKNLIPEGTKAKLNKLTAGAKTDREKAEIVYNYVQENTRYISVQLGIGGWEPMLAIDVDRLGYGDCKALTNYTKALLETQGIESNYAVVYAGPEGRDISKDFASMQGNHVILNVPYEDEDIWLECTSQTTPFNYLGDFTDNRNVLLIKPEGGEIVKTKKYSSSENLQETFSIIELDDTGKFLASVKRSSSGVNYGNIYHLTRLTDDKKTMHYKEEWGHFQNLNVEKIVYNNDRKNQVFSEEIKIQGDKLATKAGNRILVPINFFAAETFNTPRINERKFPLEIKRGFTYRDTFNYLLPEGYESESLPEGEKFENEFGSYSLKVIRKDAEGRKAIEVVREYTVNDGLWPAKSYEDFRNFMNKINSFNNQKAVIKTI